MRDILNARLERAADFIVHQGTEATENGSWSISCEELEKQTGITVRRGNGLDGMLLEALMRRSEVASVSMTDTGIDMAYHLELLPQNSQARSHATLPNFRRSKRHRFSTRR